ncbi:MAG: VanZ family protein [Candidatus Sericytochromatia bacterium]|nr:VanZ family protein [Candidatus Tanganyikabacteria bacterium]
MRSRPLIKALLLAGWMGVIFAMSAQPSSGEDSSWLLRLLLGPLAADLRPQDFATLHHLARKFGHFAEYFILALLWAWNLGAALPRLALAWALSTLYAASDEWHQQFVPNRGPAFADVLIDSLGALAALTLLHFRIKLGRGNRRQAPR